MTIHTLRRVTHSGNWSGRAHVFVNGSKVSLCRRGYRFAGDEWRPCADIDARCQLCERERERKRK